MFLKEVIPALWGHVNIYEDSSSKDFVSYETLFNGECKDIPEDLLKRKVFVISGNDFRAGELDIQLCTETAREGRKCQRK